MTDTNFGNFQNQVYAYGGKTKSRPSMRDLWIEAISSRTATRKEAVRNFVDENNLSDDQLGALGQGVGSGKITDEFVSALVGKKGNSSIKKVIEFTNSRKAYQMANGGGVEIDNLNKNTDLRDKMIDYIVSNKAYGKRMSDRQYDALEKRISDKSFVQLKKEYDALKGNSSFANGGFMDGVYARGGYVSKGELVWRKLSDSDRSNFLYENFTPEITPRSQELLVRKDFNFLPKNVKIKMEAKYANVEDYADGGELVDYSENQLMVMNQNVQIEHHHEELEDVLQNKTEVPAWVVAKMATATQNISDITHYLDGERELLEEDNEEDDEEEVIVDSITIPSSISKTEQTKKFTEDALGNMKGFLKGKDGIELEDDYTFKYKGKNYEIEPVVNYNEKGVSNALFIVYNDNDEQVGEINYTSGSGKQNFTAKSDLFNWNNVKFEDGGYFDGTIPNVSSYMSNYAKGGEIDKAEIFGLKRNIMGTTDIEMKIAGMRKPQSFIVYPINKDDSADIITIQSETRIGKIDLSNGRGLMSQSHANGAYFIHLQMDKKTPFTISESDLEKLKMQIFKTAGDNVGSRVIVTDNSGASKLFLNGGSFSPNVSEGTQFMSGVYANGGAIKNQYEGKSADEVWKDWNYDQKYHFLSDHREKIGFEEDLYNESKRTTKPKKSSMGTDIGFMYIDIDKIINTKYTELPRYVKFALLDHVRTGQYARGGGFRERNGRKYDIGRNWTKDHNYVNKSEKHEMNYNRKKSMAKGGLLTPRERYVLEIKGLTGLRVTAIENYIEENGLSNDDILNIVIGLGRRQLKGSDVATAVVGNKGNSASKKLIAFAKGNEALKMELGGAMATDLAGHTGGSMGTNTPSLLSGYSGTNYTGLVGETGAMSSGEMFMSGGSVDKNFDLTGYKWLRVFYNLKEAKEYCNQARKRFPNEKTVVIKIDEDEYDVYGTDSFNKGKTGNRVYELGGAIKDYVEVSNPNTELFQKGYGIYGGDAWETFADIKKAFPDGLPKDAFVVKLVSGKYPSFVIAEKRTDEYNNGGSLPDGVEQSYVNYYLGSTGVLAGGGSLKDAQKLNEKERFELKVLKSITGFNKGQSVGGIMQVLGFGNYKFNTYPTEEQHEKVNIALRSLKNKKFIEGDVSNKITLSDTFKITQSGADYLRSFIYASYAGGGVIDLALNKKVYDLAKKKKFLMNDYLNDNFSVSEYNIILAQALVESLTDANFHSEAKEVVAKLEKQDWSDDLYNSKYFNADQEISEFGRDVARICDYDGDDILNAYYNLAKTQGSSVGNLIEKLFLSKSGKYEEGGEVEEAIINKDGIKVKSVAQPKNKPTEAEWLAKYNESKEARTYKSGGNLSKYNQFIQDEFTASKRLANKFSKKYDSPFLVLVEKGNGDRIYVRQAESFYAFPKPYIDAHDVLYVTPDAMAFGGFFGKKQDEAPKEKVKDFTGKEVVTSDGVYVIVLMQYKDTALVKEIGNQFKDAYKIDLKKIQTPENMKMAMGGATFDEKSSAIAKKFVGKSVEPKYQKEYGKVYSKEEANEVGDKIAGSIVAKSKMTKGGITNRGGIMLLAKQIRKDNESWKDALKRAGEQLRK